MNGQNEVTQLDVSREGQEPNDRPQLISEDKPQNIVIHSLNYGYTVKVGCQTFAVETVDKLIKNLKEYQIHPHATERKWNSDKKLL